MCGRFATDFDPDEIAGEFHALAEPNPPQRSWNVKPMDRVLVLAQDDSGQHRAAGAQWSLVPSWAESAKPEYPTHNARIETALEKRTFRNAALHRRVLIPASGYYEWDRERQPWYFHDEGRPVLFLAGLASWWRPQNDPYGWLLTCTILTRQAVGRAEQVHQRMPVIINPSMAVEWTDPHADARQIIAFAQQDGISQSERLDACQVKPLNGDGPELTRPVEELRTLL